MVCQYFFQLRVFAVMMGMFTALGVVTIGVLRLTKAKKVKRVIICFTLLMKVQDGLLALAERQFVLFPTKVKNLKNITPVGKSKKPIGVFV